MSIFGVKNNNILRVDSRISNLDNILQNVHTNEYITIYAESKGSLSRDKMFSFGNGGRERTAGYVMMKDGYIISMGLSCEKSKDEVRVTVMVDGEVLSGCIVYLEDTQSVHRDFDKPFLVKAGSVINFLSVLNNYTAVNTVASLLIEFKNYI